MLTRPDDPQALLAELTERVRALQEPLRRFSDEPFVNKAQRRLLDCVRLINEHSPKAGRGDGKRQGFVADQFRDALSQCAQLEAWLSRHSLLTSVDRDWQNQGLHRYSTSALFEALHRFGIPPGGEEAFRAWAASRFPVEVASLWRKYWSGVGAFAEYPRAAAEELWKRLIGPSPSALATAVDKVLHALLGVVTGQASPTPEEVFASVDELRSRVDELPESLSSRFHFTANEELTLVLPEVHSMMEHLVDGLMMRGRGDLCARLLELQEYFDPPRSRLSLSWALWCDGDTEGATRALLELAESPSSCIRLAEPIAQRLIDLGALSEARNCIEDFISAAELSGDGRTAGRLRSLLLGVLLRLGNPEAVGFSSAEAGPGWAPCVGPLWKYLRGWRLSSAELLRFFNVVEPPVDIEALASRMEVKVIKESGMSLSGRLDVSADQETATMSVSADESETRQRYTLAFLVGHLLYSPLEKAHRRSNKTYSQNPDDGRALDFASALLTPFFMLAPLVQKAGAPPSLRELARTFRVSESAMRVAYDKLQEQIERL